MPLQKSHEWQPGAELHDLRWDWEIEREGSAMIEAANAAAPTRITINAPALAQIDCVPWVRVCDLVDTMFLHPDRIEITSLRVV